VSPTGRLRKWRYLPGLAVMAHIPTATSVTCVSGHRAKRLLVVLMNVTGKPEEATAAQREGPVSKCYAEQLAGKFDRLGQPRKLALAEWWGPLIATASTAIENATGLAFVTATVLGTSQLT